MVRKGGCWKCGKYEHLKKDCPGSAAVKGLISGHEINTLVDTGFVVTLIQEDVWIQIHAKTLVTLQPVLRSVVTASGEKLKLLGETNVKVTIGGVSGYHLVLVAQQLTQECTDFLSCTVWVCGRSAAACHHSRWKGCSQEYLDVT